MKGRRKRRRRRGEKAREIKKKLKLAQKVSKAEEFCLGSDKRRDDGVEGIPCAQTPQMIKCVWGHRNKLSKPFSKPTRKTK